MTELEPASQQVDRLAMHLVAAPPEEGGSSASWIASLEGILQASQLEGRERAASIAAAAIQKLGEGGSREPRDRIEDMQTAIVQLQQALQAPEQSRTASPPSLAQDPELISDFVLESGEHLAAIEAQALKLERNPGDREAINAAFRGFHTIKGVAGFLELWEIQKLAHEVESVLDRARNSELALTPPAIDIILQSADYLRSWLAYLDSSSENLPSEPPARDGRLYDRIRGLTAQPANNLSGDLTAAEPVPETIVAQNATVATPEDGPTMETAAEVSPAPHRSEATAVKVDTAKLDYLVDMAGEMVIAEALLHHDPELRATRSARLQRNLAQLSRITSELQKTAMAMRLVPIGPLFQRMARLVRDLARQFGKEVEMATEGDAIELDRTIVEELADPLMHMVRNAMDHGIERPQERLESGKQPQARLLLKAQHRAGQVVIEISDDGRGLNRDKILSTALERGLIASREGLAESEIHNLIFEPGFTTATEVTNVSGRGVGMDVVRRHIEKLRGRIEIRSVPGAGATFLFKLPLTLAIIDGLVVGVGSERYILPMFAVREMFRPKPETIWTVQQRGEMALVRGALFPVLRLYREFGVTPRSEDPLQSVLVFMDVEGRQCCLMVDELIGKQEVVIKGLGELFKGVDGICGGAILGDGKVGLILDIDRLYKNWTGNGTH